MLGRHPISGAPLSSLGGGALTLSGLQCTASGGALTPNISVALTGLSCTASYGNVGTIIPLLVSQMASVFGGTLTPAIAVVPTGQSATTAGGTLTPNVAVVLTGLSCTVGRGAFMPRLSGAALAVSPGVMTPTISVTLAGQAMTVQSTSLRYIAASGGSASVGLFGFTPAIAQGVATPAVVAGTSSITFTPNPAATTNVSSTSAFNKSIAHVRTQSPYVRGKYIAAGEQEDGGSGDWITLLTSPQAADGFVYVDPETRQFAFASVPNWNENSNLYALQDLNPKFNGVRPQDFYDSGTDYDGAPQNWGLGMMFGVGVEGSVHWMRVRTFEDTPYSYPNVRRFLVWEVMYDEVSNGFADYHGLEIAHDIDMSRFESSAAAEDGPVNHAIGVVPLRDTTRPKVPGSPSTYSVKHALVFHPTLWNDGTNDHWVPTYVKVTKDLNALAYTNFALVTNDVQVRSWSGVSVLRAMQSSMVTVHSGYGNVAYLAYLASTSATPRTPAYMGVMVMDLETQEIFAHEVKALAAQATPLTTEDLHYQEVGPHRPMSQAIKLSSGRSVTQFSIRGYVAHMTWTSGSHRHPLITMKAGPSSSTICAGADFLEVRGDTVYHVFMRGNSGTPTQFRPVYNDATSSTDASWTVPGSNLWTWSLAQSGSSFATQFYCGSTKGKQTWFAETVYENTAPNYLGQSGQRSGEAWIDFWSGQTPALTVEAEGRVGNAEAIVTDCGINVQLTGFGLTAIASNGLISGENKTAALVGQQIAANYTCPNGVVSTTVPLTGFGMEVAQGSLRLPGDAVTVQLTGLHVCMQMKTPSSLPPGTVQLSGFPLTAYQGAFGVNIAVPLTGLSCTASYGTMIPTVPLFNGLQVAVVAGAMVPTISVTLAGTALTASPGSLVAAESIPLTGQAATSARGTLVPQISVQLIGQGLTASQGACTPTGGATLTGQGATCAQGTEKPALAVTLAGMAVVTQRGTIIPLTSIVLAGQSLTSSRGSFGVFMARALSGHLLTVTPGTMGLSYDCNITAVGVSARGEVGEVTDNVPTPPAESHLFALVKTEEFFITLTQI